MTEEYINGALAAGTETGKPNHTAAMPVGFLSFFSGNRVFVPIDVDFTAVGHGGGPSFLPVGHA